ncbi:MAG: cupin domain-containing protein [Verrucomicrobia bacterium]|nr:cupin domain-containing protein [Verrucomicrobiota bacterium]MCH8527203.1 cupin domain-containing protein [Kiritimatiellia bacterium]
MNLQNLNLIPHPEGGRFREIHRSEDSVALTDGRSRPALTHIYYHLNAGERSRFHRVEQEEVWNLYAGSLRLHLLTEAGGYSDIVLSESANTFCTVIPAGAWQAAEPLDNECLVGCTVAPGFDFADFQLISANHPLSSRIRELGLERFM